MAFKYKEPVHVVEIGSVLATVWDQDPSLPTPDRFSVVIARKRRESPNFEKGDIPDIVEASERAREWIRARST